MEEVAGGMLASVTEGLTTVISWVGTVVTSLTGADGQLKDLLPLLAIGVSVSALMLGFKAIRSCIWGA